MCEWQHKKYIMDQPIVLNMWPVIVRTDFFLWGGFGIRRRGVPIASKGGTFVCGRLLAIVTLPIPWLHFYVPPNLDIHPTSMFSKIACRTNNGSQNEMRERWTHVVGVIAIPQLGFGMIINIFSKEDSSYKVISHNATTSTLPKYLPRLWERDGHECTANNTLCVDFYEVDYENDQFVYAPTYTYNEVVRILELAGVIAHEQVLQLVSLKLVVVIIIACLLIY